MRYHKTAYITCARNFLNLHSLVKHNLTKTTNSVIPLQFPIIIRSSTYTYVLQRVVKQLTLVLILFGTLFPLILNAQNELPRISVAERSDGLGYVVRYHFTTAPDSFKIFQPRADLIQVAIYKDGVSINEVMKPDPGTALLAFDLHDFPNGFGTDIKLRNGLNFLARAYPDANQRHLLVGLTEISPLEMQILTDGQSEINWGTVSSISRVSELDESLDFNQISSDSISVDSDIFRGNNSDSEPGDLLDTLTSPLTNYQGRVNSRTGLKTIVLDAGHGGHDPGSVGRRNREKDVALSVTKKLGAYINEHLPDVQVVYTRTDDRFIELQERGSIANRAKGDLFISIHTNSARSRQAYGAEVYFLGMARTESAIEVMKKENNVILLEDPESRSRELTEEELILYELNNIGYMSASQRLAELVDHQFTDRAQRRSRGVKQAGFIVLYHASMPAILVELGFISNANEENYLASDSGQNILASAIFRAIREYKEIIEH